MNIKDEVQERIWGGGSLRTRIQNRAAKEKRKEGIRAYRGYDIIF